MITKKKDPPEKEPHEDDPRENALDDPRQKTDWPNSKQTDEPWKGLPEKEQRNDDTKIDLEKWHRTARIRGYQAQPRPTSESRSQTRTNQPFIDSVVRQSQ